MFENSFTTGIYSHQIKSIARTPFVAIVLIWALVLLAGGCKSNKDIRDDKIEIDNHVSNIMALASQYFIRPDSMQGGNRSYLGLQLPVKYETTEHGIYELKVISRDTVMIRGRSTRDTTNTITIYLDGDRNKFGTTKTGDFR